MKRKIVQQGAATLMVSLPSKWARQQGLGKGDEVDIEEEGKKLVIEKDKDKKTIWKAKINVTGFSPLINRTLASWYVAGVDELEVEFGKKEEIKDFQKRVVNELIGFEILKQTQNSLLIKDVSGSMEQDVDEIIKRIIFILESMVDELITALEKKESLEPVIDIDLSVNKFVNFCLRILNKYGYKEQRKTPQVYSIVSSFEEIADIYKNLAKSIESGIKIDKEQIAIIKETKKSIQLFKELLLKFDKNKAIEFAKEYEKIKKDIKNKNIVDFYLMQINETIIRMNNYFLVMSVESG